MTFPDPPLTLESLHARGLIGDNMLADRARLLAQFTDEELVAHFAAGAAKDAEVTR